jgi:ubiquinone/menaquinone biosynthesis C-methylase UbiE
LPNDEDESDRLDMMHEMILTLLKGELFLAPIGPAPQRVIDIGTGTGIWAIEFGKSFESAAISYLTHTAGESFPSAEVTGSSYQETAYD